MNPGLDTLLQASLEEWKARDLHRKLRELESAQGREVQCDGRTLINFASNDYLGLASHAALSEAAAQAAGRWGWGSGSSRLISGTFGPHRELEEWLAEFKRTEAALTFSTGASVALGTLPALMGVGDCVILDKLSHACLVDGARLSGATLRVFPHNDLNKLDSHLRWARKKFPEGKILIVTESVFSMDGDTAPLREMVDLKERHGAFLMVDEAHALGVMGPQGRGLVSELGLDQRVELQMGTLSKAVGASGGYLAGSRILIDYLINRARTLVFSTAPPPPVAAAAKRGLELLASSEGDALRQTLRNHLTNLSWYVPLAETNRSTIVPILLGGEQTALGAAESLWQSGIWAPAIRYPTVARGAARLRLTLCASHTEGDIAYLGQALKPWIENPNQIESNPAPLEKTTTD